jgi:hypothetical protein
MANTGRVTYNTLTQVYADTGQPTGITKTNDPLDDDYIPPFEDPEACPPPAPIDLNLPEIEVTIRNKSKQSFALDNFIVKASSTVVGEAYYINEHLTMLPLDEIISSIHTQGSDLSTVSFIPKALALEIRMKAVISYKRGSEVNYVVKKELDVDVVDINSLVEDVGINTLREPGNGVEKLLIEFIDNPVIVTINQPPVVNVGIDREVLYFGTPVSEVLSGTAVDPDGTIVGVLWEFVSGPNVPTIEDPTALTTNVTGLVIGTYVFKLTATDDLGATAFKTLNVKVIKAKDPNGIFNILVDPLMPDDSYQITQITLKQVDQADVELLTTPLDRSSGVILKTALKGTYRMLIGIVGATAGARSIKVSWASNGQIRNFNLPQPGTYAFENVEVDEGINGVLITFSASPVDVPSTTIVYAQINTDATVEVNENILPNGLLLTDKGDVKIRFFSDLGATVPIEFTGIANVNETRTNGITSLVETDELAVEVNNVQEQLITDVQRFRTYDYDVTENGGLIEDEASTYQLVDGEGYLIIT